MGNTIQAVVAPVDLGVAITACALHILRKSSKSHLPLVSVCHRLQTIGSRPMARTIVKLLWLWPWLNPKEIATPSMLMVLVQLTVDSGKSTATITQIVLIPVRTTVHAMLDVLSRCGRAVAGMPGPRTKMVCTDRT